MLESLFGSKSVQKILFFLFVNEKCYGTQLQRLLKTSLTPLQKALSRLEKGGILLSESHGKTRIYKFNPTYPLLSELEILLKKAYTLLPPREKKNYFFVKQDSSSKEKFTDQQELIDQVWEKLNLIRHLSFTAKSKSKEESGWNGKGKGEVILSKPSEEILIFHEQGSWKNEMGKEIQFKNIFRWTLDRSAGMISLEHLRFGIHNPVFLFHLFPSEGDRLESLDSHLCGEDAYFGSIKKDLHGLVLNWRVIGPKKNEQIDYFYTY